MSETVALHIGWWWLSDENPTSRPAYRSRKVHKVEDGDYGRRTLCRRIYNLEQTLESALQQAPRCAPCQRRLDVLEQRIRLASPPSDPAGS